MTQGKTNKLWTRNFILMGLGNLFMAIGFYFLMPTLPVYVVEVLGAQKSDVGYILAAYTISALIIRPFTGMALDIWGRKWIYLISFAVFSLMLAAYPLMSSFALLLILRFCHGFAWGINTTSGSTSVVDIIPASKRGRGIGYFGMSYTISMALGPLIALFILGVYGFTAMFLAASIFALVGFVLILFVRFPSITLRTGRVRISWDRFIEKSSLPMSIPQIFFGMTYGGMISFITLFAKELNFQQFTGTFFMIIAIGIFFSRMFAGQIFDSKGPYFLMISGFGLSIIGYLLLALMKDVTGFLSAAFLIGIGSGILMPTLQTMVNNVVTIDRRGAANATITTAFDLGIGMGSLLYGMMAESIGLSMSYLSSTLLLLAGLLFFLFYVDRFYQTHKLDLVSAAQSRKK